MKIRSEDKAIEIPAGTPVGLIVQRCRGIPTYRWGRGYALTKLPKEIRREDRSQVRAIPSQEIQKACEYNAAVFWENTIQGSDRTSRNRDRRRCTRRGNSTRP